MFLPSIFTWYNVIACWDAFGNTGNLTVAVANTDEGYESDLVPLEINVGDKVVSALRANDQLNWTFTTEEDAIDGAQSGRYYAAVVIPQSFSRDMMTFYSDEVEHANIIYYANEKKNAIAPKVTDQGADQVSNQVNQVFWKRFPMWRSPSSRRFRSIPKTPISPARWGRLPTMWTAWRGR